MITEAWGWGRKVGRIYESVKKAGRLKLQKKRCFKNFLKMEYLFPKWGMLPIHKMNGANKPKLGILIVYMELGRIIIIIYLSLTLPIECKSKPILYILRN